MPEPSADDVLRQTLEDHHLSRGEKRALSQIVDEMEPDEQELARLRNVAFQLAAGQMFETQARRTLEWLEKTVKVLGLAGPANAATADEAYFAPGDDLAGRLGELLAGVRRSLDICVFTITDDRISAGILDAHDRGLPVRIITDDRKTQDLGSDIDRLAEAGVAVRIDRSEYHMHHKFAILDGRRVVTGSYNWTRSAAGGNYENFIVSHSPPLIRQFAETFEQLWQTFG